MSITAHMIVENEENFVFYSVVSVIDYVDSMLIYDSGSIDKTPEILKLLKRSYPQKIELEFGEKLSAEKVAKKRSEMLERTETEWMLVLDGDEIWWEGAISELVELTRKVDGSINGIITHYSVPCGDMFHKYPRLGEYRIGGLSGDITIRAMRVKSLKGVSGSFPLEGYVLNSGKLIQDEHRNLYNHNRVSYLHTTFLKRTSVHNNKVKKEFGLSYPFDFYYPESFFVKRPEAVPSPWCKVSGLVLVVYFLRGMARKALNNILR